MRASEKSRKFVDKALGPRNLPTKEEPPQPARPPTRPLTPRELQRVLLGSLQGRYRLYLVGGPRNAERSVSLPDGLAVLLLFGDPDHHPQPIVCAGVRDRPEAPPPASAPPRAQPHPLSGLGYQGRFLAERWPFHRPNPRTFYA